MDMVTGPGLLARYEKSLQRAWRRAIVEGVLRARVIAAPHEPREEDIVLGFMLSAVPIVSKEVSTVLPGKVKSRVTGAFCHGRTTIVEFEES